MSRVGPEDFISKEAPEQPMRPIGGECEYAPQALAAGMTVGGLIDRSRLRAAQIPHHGQFVGIAGGGGRLYSELYAFAELATGAYYGPAGAALGDVEGIGVMQSVAGHSVDKFKGLYRVAGTYIDQPAGGTPVSSSGIHESYLFLRTLAADPLWECVVASQLATRQYAMSGTIRDGVFVLSQKVWGLGGDPIERHPVPRKTHHGRKPMVYIPPIDKDADVIGSAKFARGEVRIVDPTQSLVANFAGKVATSLSLRIIERQHLFTEGQLQNVSLADPVNTAKQFAGDLTLRQTAPTVGGRLVTALDVQEAQLELARTIDSDSKLPADEQIGIEVIQFLVDALRRSRPERGEYSRDAIRLIDFAARHCYILRQGGGDPVSEMSLNLQWDRVMPVGPGTSYWAARNTKEPEAKMVRELAAASSLTATDQARVAMIDSFGDEYQVVDWARYRDKRATIYKFPGPYDE